MAGNRLMKIAEQLSDCANELAEYCTELSGKTDEAEDDYVDGYEDIMEDDDDEPMPKMKTDKSKKQALALTILAK